MNKRKEGRRKEMMILNKRKEKDDEQGRVESRKF